MPLRYELKTGRSASWIGKYLRARLRWNWRDSADSSLGDESEADAKFVRGHGVPGGGTVVPGAADSGEDDIAVVWRCGGGLVGLPVLLPGGAARRISVCALPGAMGA